MSSINKFREFSKKQLITALATNSAQLNAYANKLTELALYIQKHGSITLIEFRRLMEAE